MREDIDKFQSIVARYEKGEITPDEFKAHRVPFGIYEQRRKDAYMIRVRCAGGIITPAQLVAIAGLAREYGGGDIHLTTRQDAQIHNTEIRHFISLIKGLEKAGMSPRGGGGNTVRNIACPEDAGIDPEEVFDVSPYAVSLTTRLIAEEDSWTLPRKFKIAFSGSPGDKGYATVADVGFIAREKDGERGFRVYAAGGMGSVSRAGDILVDFLEQREVYNLVKSVKNVFWGRGNRKNKHRARLRFLREELGENGFRKLVEEEYGRVKKENYPPLEIVEDDNAADMPEGILREEPEDKREFELWEKRYVNEQKQKGAYSITVPVELGLLNSDETEKLGRFLGPFGYNVIRISKEQNFLIRNIPGELLPAAYNFLRSIGKGKSRPLVLDRMISCAGAATCQLGICHSRGAVKAVIERLSGSGIDLDGFSGLRINISGCPNSCGQHPVAHIGFAGKAGRKDGSLYPAYTVMAGGEVKDGKTRLAAAVGEISAAETPSFLEDFFHGHASGMNEIKDPGEYFRKEGKEKLADMAGRYSHVPALEEDERYYRDFESKDMFSLASRGMGECSAGIFDLIDIDLENIKATTEKLNGEDRPEQKADLLKDIVFYSARALLITRGIEPKSGPETYAAFKENFIDAGIADKKFGELFAYALENDRRGMLKNESGAREFAGRIKELYDSMDNSFNFTGTERKKETEENEAAAAEEGISPSRTKDLRGVGCPMNFVKTKMELAVMKKDEMLEILLDDGEPIENVPGSVRAEGHEVLRQEKKDGYWIVLIKKA